MVRIETMGSYWDIDEDLKKYRRWPKHEGPREIPEWGNAQAGPLQDFVWHHYDSYQVGPFALTFRDGTDRVLLCAPFEIELPPIQGWSDIV